MKELQLARDKLKAARIVKTMIGQLSVNKLQIIEKRANKMFREIIKKKSRSLSPMAMNVSFIFKNLRDSTEQGRVVINLTTVRSLDCTIHIIRIKLSCQAVVAINQSSDRAVASANYCTITSHFSNISYKFFYFSSKKSDVKVFNVSTQ